MEVMTKNLRLASAVFFLAIGLFNIGLDIFTKTFSIVSIILLALLALPLVVKNKLFTIGYGLLGMMMSGYVGLVSLNQFAKPVLSPSATDILMGYLLIAGIFLASAVLFLTAIKSSEKGRFDLL